MTTGSIIIESKAPEKMKELDRRLLLGLPIDEQFWQEAYDAEVIYVKERLGR